MAKKSEKKEASRPEPVFFRKYDYYENHGLVQHTLVDVGNGDFEFSSVELLGMMLDAEGKPVRAPWAKK